MIVPAESTGQLNTTGTTGRRVAYECCTLCTILAARRAIPSEDAARQPEPVRSGFIVYRQPL